MTMRGWACDWQKYLAFLKRDFNVIFKILLGSILTVIPVLNIMVLGYYRQCIRNGLRSHYRLPEWVDWQRLMKKGAEMLAIIVVYLIIPFILMHILAVIPFFGTIISSLLLMICILMVPMAMVNYVAYGNFKDAFSLNEIIYVVKMCAEDYLLACLLYLLVISVSLLLLFTIPFIGIVGAILIFTSGLVFFYYIGCLYRQFK